MGAERTAIMPRKKSLSKKSVSQKSGCRIFPKEFKEEAVQMSLDGRPIFQTSVEHIVPSNLEVLL